MKNDDFARHAVVWGWVAIVMTIAGVCRWPPADSGDVAAWVQGIGTIAAVGAAVWVPMHIEQQKAVKARAAMTIGLNAATEAASVSIGFLLDAVIERSPRGVREMLVHFKQLPPEQPFAQLLESPIADWPNPSTHMIARLLVTHLKAIVQECETTVEALAKTLALAKAHPAELEAAQRTTEDVLWEGLVSNVRRVSDMLDTIERSAKQ